jgi:hypothetical protein
MQIQKFWTLLLLISISFSIVHASVLCAIEDEHCSVNEYVKELSEPVECGDSCDFHYIFHISYIINEQSSLNLCSNSRIIPPIDPNELCPNGSILPSYRPPINA